MKRILVSGGVLAMFLGILAVGMTGAFFNDTETSTGNVFTAGSIDLKIDHTLSTYNGSSQGGDLVIVSDPQTQVDGHDALVITPTFITDTYWTASSSIPGSAWIWSENPAGPALVTVQKTFTRTFNWTGGINTVDLLIAADNRYSVSLNGHDIDLGAGFASDDNHVAADHYLVNPAWVNQGANTLVVLGQNDGQTNPPEQDQNPAGVKFRLEIQGDSSIWTDPVDLTNEHFWEFGDVKPQDDGRDDISLHVSTNNAWTCMYVQNVQNNENTLIEPESADGDITTGPLGNGELGNFLNLFAWRDLNANGVFEPPAETQLYQGLFGSGFTIPIHDSTTVGGPQLGNTTDYVGTAWCFGAQSVNGITGVITCDGSTTNNTAQTDSLTADLKFTAEQARNNPNFTCVPPLLVQIDGPQGQ